MCYLENKKEKIPEGRKHTNKQLVYILLINLYSSCLPQKMLMVLLSPSRASSQMTFTIPEAKNTNHNCPRTCHNHGWCCFPPAFLQGDLTSFCSGSCSPQPRLEGFTLSFIFPVLIPVCSSNSSTIHTARHCRGQDQLLGDLSWVQNSPLGF